jgi:hypothetical protein
VNTASTPAVPAAFIAWWRPNRRHAWEKIAGGETQDAALEKLLHALAARAQTGGDSIVLAAGRRPEQTAARPYSGGGRRRL